MFSYTPALETLTQRYDQVCKKFAFDIEQTKEYHTILITNMYTYTCREAGHKKWAAMVCGYI